MGPVLVLLRSPRKTCYARHWVRELEALLQAWRDLPLNEIRKFPCAHAYTLAAASAFLLLPAAFTHSFAQSTTSGSASAPGVITNGSSGTAATRRLQRNQRRGATQAGGGRRGQTAGGATVGAKLPVQQVAGEVEQAPVAEPAGGASGRQQITGLIHLAVCSPPSLAGGGLFSSSALPPRVRPAMARSVWGQACP